MVSHLHPEAAAIHTCLTKEGIKALYHFTSVENLPNICQTQALCSKQTLEGKGLWPPPSTGGKGPSHSLDRYKGNWDKVSLSLTPHTPMIFHRKKEQHLCFLLVSLEVATWLGVEFTDTNAARATNYHRGEGLSGLNYIKFEVIRSTPRPWDREGWVYPVQAEVLVPDKIPLEYISRAIFVSKASMMHAERLCGSLPHPPFWIDWRLFATFSVASQWIIDFPHVVELIVTDTKFDENVVQLSQLHKNKYSRSSSKSITAVALVRATAGIRGEIRWIPTNISTVNELDKATQYYHWSHISLAQLPDGKCSVEYYMNGLCWASTDFEIFSS